jgi:hypothetical protein
MTLELRGRGLCWRGSSCPLPGRAVRELPGHDRLETGESADHERLRGVKAAYDPANVFPLNRNIRP